MSRSRNIKPGFYKNEDLAECSIWARFIYPGLWMLADRAGRMEDRPKRIKAELLPFDAVDVEPLLGELAERGFLQRYVANGVRYLQIVAFLKHQFPHYSEKASAIPAPALPESGGVSGAATPGILPEFSGNDLGIKPESQPPSSLNPSSLIPVTAKQKQKPSPQAARFPEFWTLYPKSAARLAAEKAWAKLNLDADADTVLDALRKQLAGGMWTGPERFVPNGSSYLHGKRWEDAVPIAVAEAPPPRPPSGSNTAISKLLGGTHEHHHDSGLVRRGDSDGDSHALHDEPRRLSGR